ncbi:MAG: glycosyltransferase family 9 protein [Bacteroidales bacterium]|nr:glycosyltransferase family 9 protein [Bacteroidales bacterium]
MQRILIVRLSSIGDIVLTTPVIRCVKQQLTDVELHFLVKKQFLTVVEHNPYIDKIHVFDGDLSKTIRELKAENFDFIVDLHKNIRSTRIKCALKRPSASFPKLNYEKWLLVNFKINRLPDVHIVERYFEAVRPLQVKNDGLGLDYFIAPGDEIGASHLPKGFFDDYAVLVVGGAHRTKQIPIEKAVEICRSLDRPVVICGGAADRENGALIAQTDESRIFNACGTFNIGQSASLIRQAQQVITADTGMMHIAAAFQKNIVSLWGNTVPQFGMTPYMPQHPERSKILEVKGLLCRPCSKIGYEKCPKKHFLCMMDIDWER